MKQTTCILSILLLFLTACAVPTTVPENASTANESLKIKTSTISKGSVEIHGLRYDDLTVGTAIDEALMELFGGDAYDPSTGEVQTVTYAEEQLLSIKKLSVFCKANEDEALREINIADLARLSNLSSLAFGNVSILEFSPVNTLKGLKELWLFQSKIVDSNSFGPMTSLEQVSFTRFKGGLDSLEFLRGAKQLRTLNIDYFGNADLAPLIEAKALESLSAIYTVVQNISVLKDMKNLKTLSCSCSSEDLPVLSELTQLNELHLFDSGISRAEFEQLKKALPNTHTTSNVPWPD